MQFIASALTIAQVGCSFESRSNAVPPASSIEASRVSTQVSHVLLQIQHGYANSDWGAVRGAFQHAADSQSLVDSMIRWQREGVSQLRVTPVFYGHLGKDPVVTVQFASDARAVPDYEFFRLSTGRTPRIAGGVDASRSMQVTSRSAHFVVHHAPYQWVGTDRKYIRYLEAQRRLFELKFGVSVAKMADVYLYTDRQSMQRNTGNQCGTRAGETGCTRPYATPPRIQELVRAAFHEPIHVYELAFLPKRTRKFVYVAPLFIGEGTAVALENRHLDPRLSDYCSDLSYAPLDDCARLALGNIDPVKVLTDSGFRHADAGYAYALGGSFVKYLLLNFGFKPFARFYHALAARPGDSLADYDAAARTTYARSITELMNHWRTFLCRTGC